MQAGILLIYAQIPSVDSRWSVGLARPASTAGHHARSAAANQLKSLPACLTT